MIFMAGLQYGIQMVHCGHLCEMPEKCRPRRQGCAAWRFPALTSNGVNLVNNLSGLLGAVMVFLHESLYFIESFSGIT